MCWWSSVPPCGTTPLRCPPTPCAPCSCSGVGDHAPLPLSFRCADCFDVWHVLELTISSVLNVPASSRHGGASSTGRPPPLGLAHVSSNLCSPMLTSTALVGCHHPAALLPVVPVPPPGAPSGGEVGCTSLEWPPGNPGPPPAAASSTQLRAPAVPAPMKMTATC